jgi:hypothetical protein
VNLTILPDFGCSEAYRISVSKLAFFQFVLEMTELLVGKVGRGFVEALR